MEGKNQAILLLGIIFAIFGICNATTHTVGGSTGWTIPSSPSFYPNWASNQKFKVGDVLVFNFPAGAHTVAQVNKANYDSCNTANTIGAVQTTAPASITLTSAGTHYFICTIPGHCSGNQKLSVVVSAASSATSPASPPTPSRPATAPAASPTTPTRGATTPAASPTAPTGGATTPAASPTASSGVATSPSEGPSIPTAEGPSTPSAPAPNFATSTSVGLLSLVSFAFVALMF